MGNRVFTLADIQRTPAGQRPENARHFAKPEKGNKRIEKVSKEKEWLLLNLTKFCNDRALTLETEYKFFEYRKWQSDYYVSALRCLIEYEGLVSTKSRHTTITGYTGDAEKYSKASELGFIVLRYTALNYQNVIADLTRIYEKQTLKP